MSLILIIALGILLAVYIVRNLNQVANILAVVLIIGIFLFALSFWVPLFS